MADQLLTGLRVLDLGGHVSGALCAKWLADYGADVVLVEPPGGDPLRRRGPFVDDLPGPDRSALFWYLNGNKRGLTLDLDTRTGQNLLLRLAESSDVIVESFSPGYLGERGLGFPDLNRVNPDLILTSISPFGQSGPYRDMPATSFTLAAWSGWLHGTGEPDREPLRTAGRFADYLAAMPALIATLAAYHARPENGGQWVDISLLEAIESDLMFASVASAYTNGPPAQRLGTRLLSAAPYALRPARDGHFAVITYTAAQWENTARLIGQEQLLTDPRFATRNERLAHAAELEGYVDTWLADRSKVEAFLAGQQARLPYAYVASAADLLQMEQLQARGFLRTLEHPVAGALTVPGPIASVSEGGWEFRRPAPRRGEHTRDILQDTLGLSATELVQSVAPASPAPRRARPSAYREGSGPPPLAGVRVIDLTMFWAGPTVGRYLAELGAEVIKVESLGRMDPWRIWINAPGEPHYETSAGHNSANHNKLGITLDLATPAGQDLLLRLVAISDGIVNNFSPRVMPKLGLDYPALAAVRPDLIYLSAPGFGSSGPWRDFVAYAATVEALSGLNAGTGYLGGDPLVQVLAPGDPLGGINAAGAFLMALAYRRRTGRGLRIDTSQVEALAGLMIESLLDVRLNGRDTAPAGNRDPVFAPHGVYPCAGDDCWVAIAVTSDAEFAKLAVLAGRADWLIDPRFRDAAARWHNQEELDAGLRGWTCGQAAEDVAARLLKAGISAAPVLNTSQVPDDPHFRDRKYFQRVDRAIVGPHRYPRTGLRFSGSGVGIRHPAPVFGQHNDYILGELLGVSAAERDGLEQAAVIGRVPRLVPD